LSAVGQNRRQAHITLDADADDAGRYAVSAEITTADSYQIIRKGTLLLEAA
jgi:hypothetical protein